VFIVVIVLVMVVGCLWYRLSKQEKLLIDKREVELIPAKIHDLSEGVRPGTRRFESSEEGSNI